MDQKRCADVFGIALAFGIGAGYFFMILTSPILGLGYYLLLAFAGGVRVYLFYRTPKQKRRVYDWSGLSWRTAFLLHPASQLGIILFTLFSGAIAIGIRLCA